MAFEIEWTTTGGITQIIDFDCAESEQFESPAEITEHAVESGAAITDFVRPGNDTFTVEAWASNTPIVVKTFGLDGAVGATQPASLDVGNGKTVSAGVFQHSQPFDRVAAVDAQLVALRDAGQLLTVRTSLRETPNSVIESYKVTRDAKTGNVLAVSIDFRKIRIATTQTVQVTDPAQRRGQQTQNRGNQPAADAGTGHNSLLGNLNAGNALAGLLGH
jgi:hypothetical protein